MPTFVELQNRIKRTKPKAAHFGSEEVLIADARATMRPGDFVEEKLRAAQRLDVRKEEPIHSIPRNERKPGRSAAATPAEGN
jgi:hypothetical protein